MRKLRKMKDIEREDERQHQELLVAMYNYTPPKLANDEPQEG